MNHSKMSEANGGGKDKDVGQNSRLSECLPCGEYHCILTDLPKFLVTYTPKVFMHTCMCVHSIAESDDLVCVIAEWLSVIAVIQPAPSITVLYLLSYIHHVQVWVPFDPIYCSDRSAEYRRQEWLKGGPPQLQDLLWHGYGAGGRSDAVLDLMRSRELGGLEAVRPLSGWSHIHIPGECVHCTCTYIIG